MQTKLSDLRFRMIRIIGSPAFSSFVAMTVLATLVGPFGTYLSMSLPERAIYWGIMIGVSVILSFWVRCLTSRVVGGDPFLIDMVTSGVIALMLGPMIWFYNHFLYNLPRADLPSLGKHVLVVFAVCMIVVLIRVYLQSEPVDAEILAPPPEVPDVVFLRRLPDELGKDLVHVSADGHYLDVATHLGQERILMRFSDALAELDGYAGVRVHRSHWVALDAIVAVEQTGRRVFVILTDGHRVPVSQAHQPALTEHGFQV